MNILEITGLLTWVLVAAVFVLWAAGFIKSAKIEVTKEEDE